MHWSSYCALILVLQGAWALELDRSFAAPMNRESQQGPKRAGCDRASLRVVLDVGHTLEVGGALSARGVYEYQFNLRLATRIQKDLVSAGFVATHLLVMKGATRNLEQRAERANDMRADLFLSIHHDSVQDSYLRRWKYNGKEYAFSDKFKGYSVFVSNENPQIASSRRFAVDLADEMKAHGLSFTTHHAEKIKGENRELIEPDLGVYRYDGLAVLRHTKVPAVLLEAGVIVHRAEELTVATPEFQQRVSESVVSAVMKFCERGG
jgi:N-acetylmuramoyl-L-alanine amidase